MPNATRSTETRLDDNQRCWPAQVSPSANRFNHPLNRPAALVQPYALQPELTRPSPTEWSRGRQALISDPSTIGKGERQLACTVPGLGPAQTEVPTLSPTGCRLGGPNGRCRIAVGPGAGRGSPTPNCPAVRVGGESFHRHWQDQERASDPEKRYCGSKTISKQRTKRRETATASPHPFGGLISTSASL